MARGVRADPCEPTNLWRLSCSKNTIVPWERLSCGKRMRWRKLYREATGKSPWSVKK